MGTQRGRPWEDTGRGQLSARQGKRPQEKPAQSRPVGAHLTIDSDRDPLWYLYLPLCGPLLSLLLQVFWQSSGAFQPPVSILSLIHI